MILASTSVIFSWKFWAGFLFICSIIGVVTAACRAPEAPEQE